jgi:hypothetical protein
MKKVIGIIAVLVIISFSTSNSYGNEKQDLYIKGIGPIAGSIMKHRQSGTDIGSLFAVFDNTNHDPSIQRVIKTIIIEAYDEPKYSSPAYQQNAITEFQNRVTLECLKATQK